jgi:hypothetical protein
MKEAANRGGLNLVNCQPTGWVIEFLVLPLTWEIFMKNLIMLTVAVLLGLALTSPPTPTHAASLNAMSGGDWASKGYKQAAQPKSVAQPKAVQQKKTK